VDAQQDAEALLKAPVPRGMRGAALLLAADAAYATAAYSTAARHYSAFVREEKSTPEAPRAAMALGWARLRSGDPKGARAAWKEIADTRPADARAAFALVLAAEVATQTGDTADAERLLDRLMAWYPSTPATASGLLNRASLRLRRRQDMAAVRDVEQVIRVHGPTALEDRRRVIEAVSNRETPPLMEIQARPDGGSRSGPVEPLERFAAPLLDTTHRETTPYLLHAVVLFAAQRGGWADPLTGTLAGRLMESFPSYPPARQLLAQVGDAAAAAGQWPLARRSLETMRAHAPAMGRPERLLLAEAQLRTGGSEQARSQLESLAAGGGKEAPRVLVMLAELHGAAGDRRAALAAHERLQQDYPYFPRPASSLLSHARLLADLGLHDRARPILQKVVAVSDGDVAAEAAFRLGQGLSAEHQDAAAVEWYFTAVYVAEQSTWARHALLGAGRSLTMLKELQEALVTYWKLIPRGASATAFDREIGGEAAYRAAEILHGADQHPAALDMFKISADLTAGSSAERRALLGALQCVAGAGDRQGGELIYRRLQQAGATDSQLAEARQTLRQNDRATPDGSFPDAQPKAAR
jgi:tetratricopeptide (TPR) repeat protein